MARQAVVALLLLAWLVWPEVALAQCAMCRSTLASEEGRQLVAALRSGILFLLAAPFVAFGTVAVLAVRAQRVHEADVSPAVDPHATSPGATVKPLSGE